MGRISFFCFVIVLAALTSACSNAPPYSFITGPEHPGMSRIVIPTGGSLTLGASGANTVVTQSNIPSVSGQVLGTAFSVFGRAQSTLAGAGNLAVAARVNGDSTGYADISGSFSSGASGGSFDFSAIFVDFSDSGALFIGGALAYQGDISVNTTTYTVQTEIRIDGTLDFAGTFSGQIKFDNVRISAGTSGAPSYSGSLTVTSGGSAFNYSL